MGSSDSPELAEALEWCASVVGPVEIASDGTREHPGLRAGAFRLRSEAGYCYLKLHRDRGHWQSETHAYERWAPAFGAHAPRLLAVRDEEPLALLIGELPGTVLEERQLPPRQERAVWRSAGEALAALHNLPTGDSFGPCGRDGASLGEPVRSAEAYVGRELDRWLELGLPRGFLSGEQLATAEAARALILAFAGERPTACHRDYCPANWLVTDEGAWSGVIDFEFAYWDVRVADFSRYPNWDWIGRPDLAKAFFTGYGRPLAAREEQQLLFAHVLYAVGAIVWGKDTGYLGYAGDGERALAYLTTRLR